MKWCRLYERFQDFYYVRVVCEGGSHGYGRWFCTAIKELKDLPLENLVNYFKKQGWPTDKEFVPAFQRMKLYDTRYDRLILQSLEFALQAKCEPVVLSECHIEHVMPQTVGTDADARAWMDVLGSNWEQVHSELLHTPGNLTLVGGEYNIKMQNKPFEHKKPVLANSKVYLNEYFANSQLKTWNEESILARGLLLAQLAAKTWIGPEYIRIDADVRSEKSRLVQQKPGLFDL